MNFTQAYCPIPLCVLARNSLLNSQWPTQHLSIANWDTEAPRPSFARALLFDVPAGGHSTVARLS